MLNTKHLSKLFFHNTERERERKNGRKISKTELENSDEINVFVIVILSAESVFCIDEYFGFLLG